MCKWIDIALVLIFAHFSLYWATIFNNLKSTQQLCQAHSKKAKFLLNNHDCKFQKSLFRDSEKFINMRLKKLQKTRSKCIDTQNSWEWWGFPLHFLNTILPVVTNLQSSEQESVFFQYWRIILDWWWHVLDPTHLALGSRTVWNSSLGEAPLSNKAYFTSSENILASSVLAARPVRCIFHGIQHQCHNYAGFWKGKGQEVNGWSVKVEEHFLSLQKSCTYLLHGDFVLIYF